MIKLLSSIFLLVLLNVGSSSAEEMNTKQHEIDVKKIKHIEIIYFKKFNKFLRPFPYDSESNQFKSIISWLKSNKEGWYTADKDITLLNQMDIVVGFYTAAGTELKYTLWLDSTKVVLKYKTENGLFNLLTKKIALGKLVINPWQSVEAVE